MSGHAGHGADATALGAPTSALVAAVVVAVVLVVAQGLAVERLRRRGDAWPASRSALWVGAAACLPAAVLAPGLLRLDGFSAHVAQHVLLVMVLPVAAALAAPVTLTLRTLPPQWRRGLLTVVHGAPARALVRGPVVVALQVSGLVGFYLTPLHQAAAADPVLALVVHGHMVGTGLLFAVFLVGRDPVVPRPGVVLRLVVLFLVAGTHDTVAKVVFAHGLAGGGPTPEVQAGARLLFTAGTVVDVVLAALVLGSWYAAAGRRLRQERRRASASCGVRDGRRRAGSRPASP